MSDVAVTFSLPGEAIGPLSAAHTVRVWSGGPMLSGVELARFIGNADALICTVADRVTAEVIDACPKLAVVANYAVGVNNIDLHSARNAGVWVTNTPDVLTEATADLAWSLILAVARRVVEGDGLVRTGGFSGWQPSLLLGVGLQGKTLGIIGMGRIGRAVARRAPAFGMKVCYHDNRQLGLVEAGGAEYVNTLDALVACSDVLSIHCPLLPETRGLLDSRRLALLPSGAILINTSRGEVVDESALVGALEEGRLSGVGLDVYEKEPIVHAGLLKRNDVVLLPHLGSATRETRFAMANLAVSNVLAVLAGGVPATAVVIPLRPRR
jgi:glyoxylate reductase